MTYLAMMRNIILGIGWPVLIVGSIYIFVMGRGGIQISKRVFGGETD